MKKIYTFMMALIALLLPLAADAATVTLNIDDPSRVAIEVNREPYAGTLVAGDNTIESFYITVKATPGNVLLAVDWENGSYTIPVENNEASFGTFTQGAKYFIKTKSAAEAQSSVVKLDIDKASAVRASIDETSRMLELKDGLNEIKYDPQTEKTVKIYSAVSAQMPLYSVTIEGGMSRLEQRGNVYFLSLPCEGTVKVVSQYPDKDCKINFSFTPGSEGFLKKVTLDSSTGEEVPVVNGTATVKAGSVVYLHGDKENYLLYSYKVDDYDISFSDPQRLLVLDKDINVSFDAAKYVEFNISLTIDRPEAIIARYGSTLYPGEVFALEAGENTVVLNENKNSILIAPADAHNYRIVSVKHEGMDIEPNYDGKYQIADLASGDKVVITTEAIVRELHAVIYLDNADENLWTLKDASGAEIALHSGYNHLMVCAEDNPFSLTDGYGIPYVFVNDEEVNYSGSMFSKTYRFNLVDGSVAKIYVDTDDAPDFHALTFSQEGFQAVDVLADEMTPITRHAGYEVLAGTKVQITPHADMKVSAKLDGEDLEADEDGKFAFTVSGPHNIELVAEPTSGIAGIEAAPAEAGAIFNLQGMRLRGADLKTLPAGLYIVDGRKVLVK
ncbi:MAG: hypothetical protein K2M06_00680 [Muribaculaceae bacterium]|nr:hypothetical protein [Muribaculaceae bacterium]